MIFTRMAVMLLGIFAGSVSFAAEVNPTVDLKNHPNFPMGFETTHYFTAKSSFGLEPAWTNQRFQNFGGNELQSTDCRARIAGLMCLVEPRKGEEKRECLPGGEAYAAPFEKLHDLYPPVLQKVFCSLGVIFVEKKFLGTAYAGSMSPGGKPIMGIRQSVLDENLDLTTWASWKEQLSFGGQKDSYQITPGLPSIETSGRTGINDFLYFVVAHEFGHILDFANKINETKNCLPKTPQDEYPECEMNEKTWGSISWQTDRRPKAKNDFSNRTGLCFYRCEPGHLPATSVPQIYRDLVEQTDFISTYAAIQPWDDFADSLAYFVSATQLNTQYSIQTHQGSSFDIIAKLRSNLFQEKYQYLENFMKRTDLIYP